MDEWILKEWSHLAPACLPISFFPVFPHNGLLSRHINHQILTCALISPSFHMQQFLPRTPRCHLGYLLLVSLVRSRFGFNTSPLPGHPSAPTELWASSLLAYMSVRQGLLLPAIVSGLFLKWGGGGDGPPCLLLCSRLPSQRWLSRDTVE